MISLDFQFEKVILNTDMNNLWKSDNPVKNAFVLKNLPELFVNIKCIQTGL